MTPRMALALAAAAVIIGGLAGCVPGQGDDPQKPPPAVHQIHLHGKYRNANTLPVAG